MLPSGNRFSYPVHGEEGGVLPAQLHVITSAAKTTVVCDLLSPDGAKESEGALGRCCVPLKTMGNKFGMQRIERNEEKHHAVNSKYTVMI